MQCVKFGTDWWIEMAYKKRNPSHLGGNVVIEFDDDELQKVEKLLNLAQNLEHNFLTSEENEWLSNALMLFAPELPPGVYPI
jgi:hypothetical protein